MAKFLRPRGIGGGGGDGRAHGEWIRNS